MRFPLRTSAYLAGTLGLLAPLPCFAQGMQALADFIFDFIAGEIFMVMGGVVLIFVFYYGVRMILESHNENALTDARKSFVYALMGFAVLAITFPLMDAFIQGNEEMPINVAPIIPQFNNIIQYLTFVARGIFVLLLTFHGLRILAAQGNESEFDAARKGIIANVIGVVLMGVADAIVLGIYGNDPDVIALEIAGIAAFIVAMIGALSMLAFIVAGVMLIVSVNESLKDKAKNIVIGTIIAMVICFGSYAIIATFAFG